MTETQRPILTYRQVVDALEAATYGMPVPGAREVHFGRLYSELLEALGVDEVRGLLAYLWEATGKDPNVRVCDLFADDDPIVADVAKALGS